MLRQDLLEQEFRYDKLLLLAELGEQNTSIQLYKKAAEIIKKSINADYLLIYRKAGDSLIQSQLENDELSSLFPEKFELSEVDKLGTTLLWREGKTKLFL